MNYFWWNCFRGLVIEWISMSEELIFDWKLCENWDEINIKPCKSNLSLADHRTRSWDILRSIISQIPPSQKYHLSNNVVYSIVSRYIEAIQGICDEFLSSPNLNYRNLIWMKRNQHQKVPRDAVGQALIASIYTYKSIFEVSIIITLYLVWQDRHMTLNWRIRHVMTWSE